MAPLPKKTIKLAGTIGEDRQLKVNLPGDIPAGPVDLEITIRSEGNESPQVRSVQLDKLRDRLEANGSLGSFHLPDPAIGPSPLNDAELLTLGKLPPGARPSHELIQEDREDRI